MSVDVRTLIKERGCLPDTYRTVRDADTPNDQLSSCICTSLAFLETIEGGDLQCQEWEHAITMQRTTQAYEQQEDRCGRQGLVQAVDAVTAGYRIQCLSLIP